MLVHKKGFCCFPKVDILFILEDVNLRGGTEILTFNLLHALRAVEKDVWVLSLEPYRGSDEHVLSLSPEEYSKWKSAASSIINKLYFSIKSDRILRTILVKKIIALNPRIVVNQTYDIITALPTEMPVAQVFNWSVKGYEASLRAFIRKKGTMGRIISGFCEWGKCIRRHRMLSQVPKLIVLTEAAREELKSLNNKIVDEQMAVIPDPLTMSEDSQVHSSLTNDNICFVGRLSHEKGVMRLLHIWERVSRAMPALKLSIYGEGDARKEMESYIKEHKLQNVIFCGFCNNLEEIYLHSDLLLMTSETEGFGMVLIEAMYLGVPCISFDCPVSPKEIIADAGGTVECFDEDKYADTVIKLLQNPERLKYLQQKSIERARDFYMDKVLDRWMQLK